jgi:hypothetical protein
VDLRFLCGYSFAEMADLWAVSERTVEWLRIRRLPVGEARLDLLLRRHDADVAVNVLNREGDIASRAASRVAQSMGLENGQVGFI